MKYYKKLDDNKIKCLLCSHYCKLKDGQTGICGVNKNVNDELRNIVYGYPIAINIDPIEKKPLYHFLPYSRAFSIGTIGCNFKCPFCQNWSISQTHDEISIEPSSVNNRHRKLIEGFTKDNFISPSKIVELALKSKAESIAYTYNEPAIFYPYIKDIALLAHKHNLKNIMVTNGFMSMEVIMDMKGIIDALNIDLKSFNANYYKKVLGGNLNVIMENLILMKELDFWIEITTLIIPTINDSVQELTKIADFISENLGNHIPWHISAFHPDYKEQNLPRTSLEILQKAYQIGKKAGLKYVYIGNMGLNITRNFNSDTEGVFK